MSKLSAIDTEIEARPPKTSSERSFGLVFAGVLAIIGIWPLLRGHELRLWPFPVAGAFLLTALVAPRLLRPLNVLWLRLGAVLHRIVAPVVMGAVFFLTVVPVAMIMRLFGKDPLRLRPATSNWIERRPPGPDPKSMKYQF
jgi:hypothetical protein